MGSEGAYEERHASSSDYVCVEFRPARVGREVAAFLPHRPFLDEADRSKPEEKRDDRNMMHADKELPQDAAWRPAMRDQGQRHHR